MVPLLVIFTILSFLGVDFLVQKVSTWKLHKEFNPATDMLWHGGVPSMADGGEPFKKKEEEVKK